MAAIFEKKLGVSFLEVAGANFSTRNLSGNRENRHPASMTIEKSIDKMEIARPATSGADSQLSRDVRVGTSGEGSNLFMSDVDPFNRLFAADRVDDADQRIAHDTVNAFGAHVSQSLNKGLRHGRHGFLLPVGPFFPIRHQLGVMNRVTNP